MLESTCVGRPLREMRAQLGRIPEFYRYFAAVARTAEDAVTPFEGAYPNRCVRRACRWAWVVGQLTPWNHPLLILTKARPGAGRRELRGSPNRLSSR